MHKGVARVLVYPLLLINIAVGFLWINSARSLFLVFLEWLYRDGRLTDGSTWQIPFIIKSFDNAFFVVAALGLLALFVVLEYRYTDGAHQGLLLQRFIRFLGFEILTLGVVQLTTDLMLGQTVASALGTALTLFELGAGAALVAVTFLRLERAALEETGSQ